MNQCYKNINKSINENKTKWVYLGMVVIIHSKSDSSFYVRQYMMFLTNSRRHGQADLYNPIPKMYKKKLLI